MKRLLVLLFCVLNAIGGKAYVDCVRDGSEHEAKRSKAYSPPSSRRLQTNIDKKTIELASLTRTRPDTIKIDKTKPTTVIEDKGGNVYSVDNKTGEVKQVGQKAPSSGPNAAPSVADASIINSNQATVVWKKRRRLRLASDFIKSVPLIIVVFSVITIKQ